MNSNSDHRILHLCATTYISCVIIIGPVWYNFPRQSTDERPLLLKRGVVRSVSFDYPNPDLVYEVGYNGNEGSVIEEVSENQLMFGSNCPVIIASGDTSVEGTILLCKCKSSSDDQSKILYTVMTFKGGQLVCEEGVGTERITYRKVQMGIGLNTQPAAIVEKDKNPTAEARDDDQVSVSASVPASITCDSEVAKSKDENKEERGPSRRNENVREDTTLNSNNAQSKSSTNGGSLKNKSHNETHMQMSIPLWLQRDRACQKNIFCKYRVSSVQFPS